MEENKNPLEIKNKIISLLRIRGPCLPVHVARETGISSLFAGAFLSELASEKEIKISIMKVGGSPLYFLSGQESQLEKFSSYLPGKEKEAFSLLKQKSFLEDGKLEPSIRVALRNLKDFAVPFNINNEEGTKLLWRFHSKTEQEFLDRIKPKIKITEQKKLTKQEKEKPLLEIKEKKLTKKKEKPDFAKEITSLLESGNLEIIEELENKKREYSAIIKINSELGKLKFLCLAKDKKRISENDLSLATQKAQSIKMPVLFLSPGELNKKALSYLESYSGLIKFKRIKD